MSKVKPVLDRILVREIKQTNRTLPSGIAIPDSYGDEIIPCRVLEMGGGPYMRGELTITPPCSSGQVILIHKGAGFKFGDSERIIDVSFVLAVVEES